jgi:hypothetical protein
MNQHESGPESIQHPQAVCAGALHAIHGLEAKYLKMLLEETISSTQCSGPQHK